MAKNVQKPSRPGVKRGEGASIGGGAFIGEFTVFGIYLLYFSNKGVPNMGPDRILGLSAPQHPQKQHFYCDEKLLPFRK